MNQQPSRSGAHAFTLVELLVVIGIPAVLIAILLPSLMEAREAANAEAIWITGNGQFCRAHV